MLDPKRVTNLSDKMICVTGGEGFLGRNVVAALADHGCRDVFTVSHAEYDLLLREDIDRLYRSVKPQVVIHLAFIISALLLAWTDRIIARPAPSTH